MIHQQVRSLPAAAVPRLSRSPALSLMALLAAALPAAAAPQLGPHPYEGPGFKRHLGTPGVRTKLATFDHGHDGALELLRLDATGTLNLHARFMEYDRRVSFTEMRCMAVVHGAADRVFVASATGLLQVLSGDTFGQTWQKTDQPQLDLVNIRELSEVQRPAGNQLLVVDQGGARLSLYDVDSTLNLAARLQLGPQAASFVDATRLDWDGDGFDEWAVASGVGLEIFDDANVKIVEYEAVAQDAFLHVVRGAQTQWGRDLLFYHHRSPSNGLRFLRVLNTDHDESLYVEPLRLQAAYTVDFQDGLGAELALPSGSDRRVLLVRQLPTNSVSQPCIGIDWSNVNEIDLDFGSPSVPSFPPSGCVADLDGDGDQDLILEDDRGDVSFVTSTWHDENERRSRQKLFFSEPQYTSGSLKYAVDLTVPSGASRIAVEVWRQPDLGASSTPTLLWQSEIDVPEQFEFQYLSVPMTAPPSGIYSYLFRPLAVPALPGVAYPVVIETWSPDANLTIALSQEHYATYPWFGPSADGPGGTTQRPVINPGGGTGTGTGTGGSGGTGGG